MARVLIVHNDSVAADILSQAFISNGFEVEAPVFPRVIDICNRGASDFEIIALVHPSQFDGFSIRSYSELLMNVERSIEIINLGLPLVDKDYLERLGFRVLNEGKIDCSSVEWTQEIIAHIFNNKVEVKAELLTL